MKEILLGNFAVARGAYEAGATVATAYPGTPSTEITEEISKYKEINTEWSANEKVAMEVAIGASIMGARSIVCMKHVGVNVAADPLFTASYTGINGGLVVVVADDPGMHSSQNEQDSRFYARMSMVPMLEPSDSSEAKDYVKKAFEISEKFDTPCFVRLTTRVSHSRSIVELAERDNVAIKDYEKNIPKYVMVPALAKKRHIVVEKRTNDLQDYSNNLDINSYEINSQEVGVVVAGAVYQYVKEILPDYSVFKVGMCFPLPIEKIREFSKKVKKLIVIEELEPYMENQLKANGIDCVGKELFSKQGEITPEKILQVLKNIPCDVDKAEIPDRPPVMCPGCPHRGIYHILKKNNFTVMGDIGCYSLGAAAPLNAVDTVICMGASIGMAMGAYKARGVEFAKKTVAVIGDSTFVHSGITELANAVYNKGVGTVIILDNSTTGMTGHQNHPATGVTITGEDTYQLNLKNVCEVCGVTSVKEVDAYDIVEFENTLKDFANREEVSVIIAKRPCILLPKVEKKRAVITDLCKNCKSCLSIGCPSISVIEGKIKIDPSTCTGCLVCSKLCKFNAISVEG